jgi:hypothetical protein
MPGIKPGMTDAAMIVIARSEAIQGRFHRTLMVWTAPDGIDVPE